MTAQYPIADRHSSQSWHQRFKKNATPFTRRIRRLMEEGVDKTLKTENERVKTAQSRLSETTAALTGQTGTK